MLGSAGGWFESRVSFSETGYLIKAEEHSLPYYLSIGRGGADRFMLFINEK